jgi:pectinesterase
MKKYFSVIILSLLALTFASAQSKQKNETASYLTRKWGEVATRMPASWYGSEEAKLVAENLLISQKESGGWAKNKPYHHPYSDSLKTAYLLTKNEKGGTFDNGSTITELRFLAKVYAHFKDPRYKHAFEKGINYILAAQYENGGWPQYFPVKEAQDEVFLDKTVPYSMHITFNDNAMVNVMELLREIYMDDKEFAALKMDDVTKEKAKKAFDKGVDCILKAQIRVNNKPTVWCAQHHEKTLAPANARAYELASFSGSESVGIIELLMDIDHPSKDIVAAVNGAIKWLDDHKIEGIRIGIETDPEGKSNKVVVNDKNATPLWGRFYDLETGKIYFCSRDGIKRGTMAEISYERRNGYSWYTDAPAKVLKRYPEWQKKWSPDNNALSQ